VVLVKPLTQPRSKPFAAVEGGAKYLPI
jgi:hypothetical protein